MISDELRERLKPCVKECLLPEDYPKLDAMLEECYLIVEDGVRMIVVSNKPFGDSDLTMKFLEETGEFIGPEKMQYAREYGELL